MACLDTTILIDGNGRDSALRERCLAKIDDLAARGESLVTTCFNVAELYVGVARSDDAESEEKKVQRILGGLSILEFNDKAVKLFGQITATLHQTGRPAGDMDVLIAATAMAHGHLLVTRNAAHFRSIPSLLLEQY